MVAQLSKTIAQMFVFVFLICIILSQGIPMGIIRGWRLNCQKAAGGWRISRMRGLTQVFTVRKQCHCINTPNTPSILSFCSMNSFEFEDVHSIKF